MDLFQSKLTKAEWDSVEKPVSLEEKKILKMIIQGYHDLNISQNNNYSLLGYLKIQHTEYVENYIFDNYFLNVIKKQCKKYDLDYDTKSKYDEKKNLIKKGEMVKLQQNNFETIDKDIIYEFTLLECLTRMLRNKKKNNKQWIFYYYTLYHLIDYPILYINNHVKEYLKKYISLYENEIDISDTIEKSYEYIEKNEFILDYANIELYKHQKQIYSIFKNLYKKNKEKDIYEKEGKLVLYIAPTATGKTLTPIGLSENYKIIFVCAARHVGIALAKSALSCDKKVAFGFGCNSADDIRLHYSAAKEYTKDWRTGGIRKVDNSVGDKVEIMICDIQSYRFAMYYMTSFNSPHDIITFWDEPTISMDYEDHPCHDIISKNWSENIIPNMVLSSATLPKEHEIVNVTQDFRQKFPNISVHSILSDDCKKTISLINTCGYIELPHFMYSNYNDIIKSVEHCENYPTILRYFDLHEISRFIVYIHKNDLISSSFYSFENVFPTVGDIKMKEIKQHYLNILKNIKPESWEDVYNYFQKNRYYFIKPNNHIVGEIHKSKSVDGSNVNNLNKGGELTRQYSIQAKPQSVFNDISAYSNETQHGVFITTRDSYTLTSGPTIYLAEDTEKIAKFCLKQSNIPKNVMNNLMEAIQFNSKLSKKLTVLDKNIEDKLAKNSEEGKEHKLSNDKRIPDDVKKMMNEVKTLQNLIKPVNIDDSYIPNKLKHLMKWTGSNEYDIMPYTSNISEEDIEYIMKINVDNIWKILIVLGIGLFSQNVPIEYTEKVKELAISQKLYLIIANEDFIYGTNYQFCHGYISKDLNMTQEKIIQSMGRIGRNKLQHTYSVRVRDDKLFQSMFNCEENKKEVLNMNKLLKTIVTE